ncbi:hypothetical protein U9M48_025283, partial [Paspalum notatum var. saurae]
VLKSSLSLPQSGFQPSPTLLLGPAPPPLCLCQLGPARQPPSSSNRSPPPRLRLRACDAESASATSAHDPRLLSKYPTQLLNRAPSHSATPSHPTLRLGAELALERRRRRPCSRTRNAACRRCILTTPPLHGRPGRHDEPVNSRSKATEYGERTRDAGPNLPEEIWCHIHSLMPMEDSARAACVSRTFLHSWRHHPYLILNNETLGLKWNACGKDSEKHSVAGVKTLKLDVSDCCDLNDCYLNDWLHIAITPRTESVTLELPSRHKEELYNFPCSLL